MSEKVAEEFGSVRVMETSVIVTTIDKTTRRTGNVLKSRQ